MRKNTEPGVKCSHWRYLGLVKLAIVFPILLIVSCANDNDSSDKDREAFYLSMGTGVSWFDTHTPSFSGDDWGSTVDVIVNGQSVTAMKRGFSLNPLDSLRDANTLVFSASEPMENDVYMAFSRLVQVGDEYRNTVLWRKKILGNSWIKKEYMFTFDNIEEVE